MNQNNKDKNNKSKENKLDINILKRSGTVILIILMVVLAGSAGAFIAFNYFSDYLSDLVRPAEVQVVSPTARVVSPGSIESAVDLAEDKVIPAMATFYAGKEGDEPGETIFFDEDMLGTGVVFTSDGWLITSGEIFNQVSEAMVVIDGSVYSVESVLTDEITGAAFVKVAGENLPVIQLANDDYVASGDRVVMVSNDRGFAGANIINKSYNPVSGTTYLESSEIVGSRMLLSEESVLGAAIINYNAEVVGLYWGGGEDAPIGLSLELLKPLMKSLLKEGRFDRSYLGVRYLDLARLQGLGEEVAKGKNEGAVVWSGESDLTPAVASGSPAEEAGIEKGDIILSVNDKVLNGHGSLSEVLLDYNPGDRLNLEVFRQGNEISLDVILGSTLNIE